MRLLYLFLWFALKYSFRLYYRQIHVVNKNTFWFGRTIFVSNHPGSFMDPLIIAALRRPIVFFMTRSDVFNRFTKPIFWLSHMLPIYRQRDNVNTKEKNAVIFQKTNAILKGNRNVLIFGEGFTEDRIQRKLNPLKKGPFRIGFSALEFCDWKYPIYVQSIGMNYADVNLRRSDLVISAGNRILLNDYREAYEANPAKVINELTKALEKDLSSILIDVHDTDWTDFHENLMMFTRKGLHPTCFDSDLNVTERWEYGKKLGLWLNNRNEAALTLLKPLRSELEAYNLSLKKLGITEAERFAAENHGWKATERILYIVLLFPFILLGLIHAGIPYFVIKSWVEKKFKRPVFWSSTKMVAAIFSVLFLNLPLLFIVPQWLPFNCALNLTVVVVYFLCIGLFAGIALAAKSHIEKMVRMRKVSKLDLEYLHQEHADLLKKIQDVLTDL